MDVFKHDITGSISYLHLFAGWAKQFYKPDDNNPEHFDQGLLLSRRLCGKDKSCGVNGQNDIMLTTYSSVDTKHVSL